MVRTFTRRLAVWALAAALLALAPCVATLTTSSALAQSARGGGSFLTPFPDKDTWNAVVVGDGLAEGLLHGLLDAMASEPKVKLERKRQALRAIGRSDFEDEIADMTATMTGQKAHVAILWLGISDRTGMRLANGRRLRVGAEGWREQFGARVDAVLRALRSKSVAVYWIGLPIMRSDEWNEDANEMNTLLRERVTANGGRFIDIYGDTADENGEFVYRGPDVTGKVVRLRDGDGIDFTPAGYRKVAFFVERQMKRDMARAREERAVPLAGAEAEQARINVAVRAQSPAKGRSGNDGKGDARSPAARAAAAWGAGARPGIAGGLKAGDQKADNGRVSFKVVGQDGKSQTVTMDIVRPALGASVIALVTRRDKGDKASEIGETLTDTLSNGLMLMRSVTPAGGERRGRSTAPTQQPFFLALTKGARLPSKPGRADDFRWPREDDLPPPPSGRSAGGIVSPVDLRKAKSQRNSKGRGG